MSLVSLFVSTIPEPLLDAKMFLSLFIPLLTKYSVAILPNFGAAFLNAFTTVWNIFWSIAASKSARIPRDCIIWSEDHISNQNFPLDDEPFGKAL